MIKIQSVKTNKPAKRLGRGMGSGVGGHTVGRGGKGQTARGGHKSPRPGFEGGQNPISRRLPKLKGFTRGYQKSKTKSQVIRLSEIDQLVQQEKLEKVNIESLMQYGLLKSQYNKTTIFKVLFDKEPLSKINLEGVNVSKTSEQAIIKAGGSVTNE